MTGPNKSWELSEFDTHANRLQGVAQQVAAAQKHMDEVHGKNGEAFGKIFGWAVAPALDALCGGTSRFSATLGTAMDASAHGITEARDAYQQTEKDNVDRSKQVESELQQQRGRVK